MLGAPFEGGGFADGLAHDILARLSRLRALFVIAPGSSFRFRGAQIVRAGRTRARRALSHVTGSVPHLRRAAAADGGTGGDRNRNDGVERHLREGAWAMCSRSRTNSPRIYVAALEIRNRGGGNKACPDIGRLHRWTDRALTTMACGTCTASTRRDNERARHFFRRALEPILRPGLCRPVVHPFPECLPWLGDRVRKSTEPSPPGRASWWTIATRRRTGLWAGRCGCVASRTSHHGTGTCGRPQPELCTRPLHARLRHSQAGDPAAVNAFDHSRHLSPFDPLLFGMLEVQAPACAGRETTRRQQCGASGAARQQTPHVHIYAIAAFCDALAERRRSTGAMPGR